MEFIFEVRSFHLMIQEQLDKNKLSNGFYNQTLK